MGGGARLSPGRIEDYALLGDTHSAALVSMQGSIDWLCLPRFDSPSVFAALLDPERGGRWSLRPAGPFEVSRSYRPGSMVLETIFSTPTGEVVVTDCLPVGESSDPKIPRGVVTEDAVVRLVEGRSGEVELRSIFAPRFDYGYVHPWLRSLKGGWMQAVGGPIALDLGATVPLVLGDGAIEATFEVRAGDSVSFVAAYHPSHVEGSFSRGPADCRAMIECTDAYWREWSGRARVSGPWSDLVVRSLLTLKALTYSPTGGIVAAPTTSLPEKVGGVRNWDYRYCWLRDATFTLDVLLEHGYTSEAIEWRDWLLRAVAGDPDELQIMYGVGGERRLVELELPWLSGYEGSRPVRIGNAALEQLQLDVYGEVLDSLHSARRAGVELDADALRLQRALADHVCVIWREPDEGIWEVRSGRRHFVHSKVMAWVALDRALEVAAFIGEASGTKRWAAERDAIRREVFERGVSAARGCFVRSYGEEEVDASLLMLPMVGFVEADDPRMLATLDAVMADLCRDGFVMRYRSETADDGLPPGEGAFLLCSFWLVD